MERRAFIAINLPNNLKDVISLKTRDLKKYNLPVKWVEKENLHLTLKFLKNLDKKEFTEVGERLEIVFQKPFPSFSLTISGLEIFPLNFPKIISLKIKESSRLLTIWKKIEETLDPLEFIKPEIKTFKSHITLGRIKKAIKNFPSLYKNFEWGEDFKVETVDLMESQLGLKGPAYTILKSFPLKI